MSEPPSPRPQPAVHAPPDPLADRLAHLRDLFPEAVSEGRLDLALQCRLETI